MNGHGNELNDHDVAVFWDHSTCSSPSSLTGYEVANSIRCIAQTFGSIKVFKAYLSISLHESSSKRDRASALRSELQVSGVSLPTDVDTSTPPLNGGLNVMLTADMYAYALDKTPLTATIVLVTKAPALAYAVSLLRLRNYRVVVVTSSLGGQDTCLGLTSQGSIHFDWDTDVLKYMSLPNAMPGTSTASPHKRYPMRSHSRASSPDFTREDRPSGAEQRARIASGEEVELKNFSLPQNPHTVKRKARASDTETPDELLSPHFRGFSSYLQSDRPSTPSEITGRPLSKLDRPLVEDSVKGITSIPSTPRATGKSTAVGTGSIPARAQVNVEELMPRTIAFQPTASTPSTSLSPTASVFQPSLATLGQRPTPSGQFMSPRIPSTSSISSPQKASYSPQPSARTSVVPAFQPLVDILRSQRAKGSATPLRSSVALELIQKDKDVYAKAGVQKFSQYSALAEKEGIVKLGGKNGGAWIQLHEPI